MAVTKSNLQEIRMRITENIEDNKARYLQTSHDIHNHPEVGNEEFLLQRF